MTLDEAISPSAAVAVKLNAAGIQISERTLREQERASLAPAGFSARLMFLMPSDIDLIINAARPEPKSCLTSTNEREQVLALEIAPWMESVYRRSTKTTDKRLAERHREQVRLAVSVMQLSHGEGDPDLSAGFALVCIGWERHPLYASNCSIISRSGRSGISPALEIRNAAKIIYPDASAAAWNHQVITPMRAVINHAADAKRLPKISVKRFKEDKKRRPAGNQDWLKVFSATAKSLDMPETAAMARFMFETATRISEACRLKWHDVDLQLGVPSVEDEDDTARGVPDPRHGDRTGEYPGLYPMLVLERPTDRQRRSASTK